MTQEILLVINKREPSRSDVTCYPQKVPVNAPLRNDAVFSYSHYEDATPVPSEGRSDRVPVSHVQTSTCASEPQDLERCEDKDAELTRKNSDDAVYESTDGDPIGFRDIFHLEDMEQILNHGYCKK